MRKLLAAGAALLVAGAAGGLPSAHTFPKILVRDEGTAVTIEIAHDDLDEAAARLIVYPPAGYQVELGQPPGTTVGTAQGLVTAPDLGLARIVVAGGVVARSATSSVSPDGATVTLAEAARRCTGSSDHDAYWVLALRGSGQMLELPLFVDGSPPRVPGFAAATIRGCLPPPDVPAGSPGRAPLGFELARTAITLRGVFRGGPAGERRWRLVETEFVRGGDTPNAADTSEAQAVVYAGGAVSLEQPVVTMRGGFASVALRGLTSVPGRAEPRYQLQLGRERGSLRPSIALQPRGRTITGRLRVRPTGTSQVLYVQARGTVETLGLGASFCRPTFRADGIPCVYATRMGAVVLSAIRRVVVPPRR